MSETTTEDEIWRTDRVAEELTLSPYTVENWARQGRLPSFKIGRLRRYSRRQILEWKDRQMNPNPYR